MKRSETAEEFYRKRYPTFPAQGQFNVFERNMEQSGQPLPYSRRDFYKVSFVTGNGRLLYANKDYHINRPALLFSNPMVPYSWEALSEQQGGYICIFTEAFLRTKDRNLFLKQSPLFRVNADPVYFLDERQQQFVEEIFRNMLKELATDYSNKYDLLINYVNFLLHESIKMQPDQKATAPRNASARISTLFLELLQRQFPVISRDQRIELRTAAQFAENLCIHVNHLNHAVREITGRTTSAHISESVANEARSLLMHTDWSIADIAWCLGFESASYFNSYIKRITGVTPRILRG